MVGGDDYDIDRIDFIAHFDSRNHRLVAQVARF
nr:MAG TPA: hypothetical protein [Caudoviricetes sp.]